MTREIVDYRLICNNRWSKRNETVCLACRLACPHRLHQVCSRLRPGCRRAGERQPQRGAGKRGETRRNVAGGFCRRLVAARGGSPCAGFAGRSRACRPACRRAEAQADRRLEGACASGAHAIGAAPARRPGRIAGGRQGRRGQCGRAPGSQRRGARGAPAGCGPVGEPDPEIQSHGPARRAAWHKRAFTGRGASQCGWTAAGRQGGRARGRPGVAAAHASVKGMTTHSQGQRRETP